MKLLTNLAVLLLLMTLSVSVDAIPIRVEVTADPGSPILGEQVEATVSVDGLTGEFIGAYDVTLAFDGAILSFDELFFDVFLDGPADSLQDVVLTSSTINAAEISLGFLFNQTGIDAFPLFSVLFDTVGAGTSPLDLSVTELSDDFGFPLESTTLNSSVSVQEPVAVPEPGTASLLLIGLLAFAVTRRLTARAQSLYRLSID